MRLLRSASRSYIGAVAGVLLCVFFAAPVSADTPLSITVTPPLFQLAITPGETWASTIKIVNNNPYDVTYYASPVDFVANGEDGGSKYIPLIDEAADPAGVPFSLASWIDVTKQPIIVKAGAIYNLQFTIHTPSNAEPGGHYAAILIGTQAFASGHGTQMAVSSYVSSLIFVRIKGDAVESARIRQFTSDQELYQSPQADFVLRFENTGTTHLRPAGNIKIYNMWGKERGTVEINRRGDFGNVLPHSIRKFQFSWTGEENPFDIGLYRAIVTLDYGDDAKQNISAVTYFWVVPVVPISIALGIAVFIVVLIGWFIRRYIRRALELEQRRLGIVPAQMPTPASSQIQSPPYAPAPVVRLNAQPAAPILTILTEPIREGVIDLRRMRNAPQAPAITPATASRSREVEDTPRSFMQLIGKYRLFVVFIVCIVFIIVGLWWYLTKVLVGKRGYQITDVTIQSETIPER